MFLLTFVPLLSCCYRAAFRVLRRFPVEKDSHDLLRGGISVPHASIAFSLFLFVSCVVLRNGEQNSQMCKPSALRRRRRLSQYEYDIDLLYLAQYNTEAREGRTSDISQSDIPVLKLLCKVQRGAISDDFLRLLYRS
jgi:hypothetical protein